jgi:two-component system OmpR family sensor kinase
MPSKQSEEPAWRGSRWHGLRGGRLSLRSRLLLGLIGVAAIGFCIAGAIVYAQIRSYLDNQLQVQVAEGAVSISRGAGLDACALRGVTTLPVGSWIFIFDTSPLQQVCPPKAVVAYPSSAPPASAAPVMPQSWLGAVVSAGDGGWTTATSSSGVSYELYATAPAPTPFGFSFSTVVIAAEPTSAVDNTLHQLLLVEIAVYAGVLALLAALGYAVVRVGLRPLEEIEVTAGKIAAGDLSRRVERDEPETEVGRLGASLNSMLGRIEDAFAEQQASERRMRRFVADAAHELRTPLTSIRGYAELFRRGAATRPEDLERSMRRIEEEATRMGVLVEDLLLLARLDQGRPLEHARVDLAALAADAAADAQAVQPDRPVSYEASGPVVVGGDEARLRQVVANLVQNALVHTPRGTPVSVSVRREGAMAVLEVADSGPGIAPEHAAHIFERFYRADTSRARKSGGTGLGLAIVASLAAAHGGRASVHTAPGAGTRFRVELPALDGAAVPVPPPAGLGRAARPALSNGEGAAALPAAPPQRAPEPSPGETPIEPAQPAAQPVEARAEPTAPAGEPTAPAGEPKEPAAGEPKEPAAGEPKEPAAGEPKEPAAGEPTAPAVEPTEAPAERGAEVAFGGASGFAEDWDVPPSRVAGAQPRAGGGELSGRGT